MKQHPLYKDEVLGAIALSLIRTGEIGRAPKSLEALSGITPFFEIYIVQSKDGQKLVMDMGERTMSVGIDDVAASVKGNLELFIRSLADCSKENVRYYAEKVISEAQSDLLQLQQLQQSLRSFLLPRAHLAAVVTIHNSGRSPVTFKPFLAMRIVHPDLASRAYVMAVEQKVENNRNPFALTSGGFTISVPSDELEGKKVFAKPYLAETSAAPYISIPSGEAREITLVALDPLGNDAESIKRIHETRLLKCQVIGTTSLGKDVWSEPAEFSEKVGQEEKERLSRIQQ